MVYSPKMADNCSNDKYLQNASLLETMEDALSWQMAPVTAYMVVIMLTGIVGNSLVCYVHGLKMKKSTANSFILWLAVLDLTTCSVGLPMETYDLVKHYTFGMPTFCKILRFIVYLTTVTAVITLVFIAIDRYCKICRPLKSSPVRRCRVVVVVSLTAGALLSWPALFLFGTKLIKTEYAGLCGKDCSIDDSMIGSDVPKIYLSVLMLAFFSGAIVLVVLYTLIGVRVYRRSQSVIGENVQSSITRPQTGNRTTGSLSSSMSKTTNELAEKRRTVSQSAPMDKRYKLGRTGLIFLTITLVFILSFLPSLVLMTARAVSKGFAASLSDTEFTLYSFGLRTYFLNNAVNCFIYGFLNPLFRKECVKIGRKMKLSIAAVCCIVRRKNSLAIRGSVSTSKSENATEESLQPV